MFRLRLASLAIACGLLLTMSGCMSVCDEGRPRLFRSTAFRPGWLHGNKTGQPHECECQTMPEGMHGPIMTTPHFPPAPIPITNMPPHIQKVPQAPATPYFPNPG
jgi:hypothetical protein